MKKRGTLVLFVGSLMVAASLLAYAARITTCYPPASTWKLFTAEHLTDLVQTCRLDAPITVQFGAFLGLFLPGIILFSFYWLYTAPAVQHKRGAQLSVFMFLIMVDSLLIAVYGMLGYPVPGNEQAPAAWAVEAIAVLGFLSYLSTLALWHWKRWGLILFQAASILLAAFILLGGGSIILSGVIIAGVLGLSLLLRPVRIKFV
jgi:hypothetical protein